MDYVDCCVEEKLMKENLINDLSTEEWKRNLFFDKYLQYEHLYESEEKIRLSLILPYGGFNNPNDIDIYLKEFLISSIDEIFEWFFDKKQRVLRMKFELKSNIGYVISERNGVKEETNQVVLALRRDNTGATKYGFYISAFNVV